MNIKVLMMAPYMVRTSFIQKFNAIKHRTYTPVSLIPIILTTKRAKWFYMCKIFYGQGDPHPATLFH